MKKRGQSQLITIVLSVLLVLAAIIIVWNVVRSMTEFQSNKVTIDPFINRISFDGNPYHISGDSSCVFVDVFRESGQELIEGIWFEFLNDGGERDTYIERDSSKFPIRLSTERFVFCYPQDINIDDVSEVSFRPIFSDRNSDDVYGLESKDKVIDRNDICLEDWNCSPWGICDEINNIETRSCLDSNNCLTEFFKPSEILSCVVPSNPFHVFWNACLKGDDNPSGSGIGCTDIHVINFNSYTASMDPITVPGDYKISFPYEVESGQSDEHLIIQCGTREYLFIDTNFEDGWTPKSIVCDFDVGDNSILFTSDGTGSVHFLNIRVESLF
jgi:hypothetical protein